MPSPPDRIPPIDQRSLPGKGGSVSAIALAIDPPAVAPPSADARTVALLRRARVHGVTTFDVADARHPERVERLIAAAFPSDDPDLGVVVGRSVESLAREPERSEGRAIEDDLETAIGASIARSAQRLSPARIMIVEWEPSEGHETAPPIPATSPSTDSEVRPPTLATRLSRVATALPRMSLAGSIVSDELSLLDDHVISLMEATAEGLRPPLLARNPFADGRLDGSRFEATAVPAGPGEGPVDLRRLHAEFDPVLRLGFLTERRRRTLAQAALQFVLAWPWVVSVVVPLPHPERFDEVLGFASATPFDTAERRALGLMK